MAGITGTELARRRRPCRHPCGSTTPGINVGNGQALDKAGWRGAPGWFELFDGAEPGYFPNSSASFAPGSAARMNASPTRKA